MNLWVGHAGLAVAFVILAAVLSWIVINTRGRAVLKAVLIAATLWYGLVLFFTAPSLMGWPSGQPIPENSLVLAVQIREPDPRGPTEGAIYLWVRPAAGSGGRRRGVSWLNPAAAFSDAARAEPRAYRLAYSKALHRAIVEAQRRAQGVPGAQMRVTRRGPAARGQGDENSQAPMVFEIVNPVTRLPK